MVRCPNCGKVNRDAAFFCQQCGFRLPVSAPAAATRARDAPEPFGEIDGQDCAVCGAAAVPGADFCKACGAALTGTPRACPQCGGQTSSSFAFCHFCGCRLASPAEPADPDDLAEDVSQTLPAVGTVFAGGAAARPAAVAARLVAVLQDGREGPAYPLPAGSIDVGRGEGGLCFPDDPYLAERHARLASDGEGVRVTPIDRGNGVYLRLREAIDLEGGDRILVGRQVLAFELVDDLERDAPPVMEHGVLLFGTPTRVVWGRVRQLGASGMARNVWVLHRDEAVIGREEGDLLFPDDEFLSRRHAVMVRGVSGRPRLLDMGSSNGTYLRLRGCHELRHGDHLRMGEQLLRFERA